MNADDISTKLHKRADESLKKQIEQAFNPAIEMARHISQREVVFTSNGTTATLNWYVVIATIKEQTFLSMQDRCRDDEVRAFIDKVDGLESQIDELRGGLQ